MLENYRDALADRSGRIGVWGVGYIGCSTMAYYANAGVKAIGFDPDRVRVAQLNSGTIPVPGLDTWFDFDTTPLIAGGLMCATHRAEDLLNEQTQVHFICVPTERRGKPDFTALKDVAGRLSRAIKESASFRPLVIVESTLTPGTTDNLLLPMRRGHGIEVARDVLLGIAPRRDWFVARGQSMRNPDRGYGGVGAESTEATFSVLSLVCERLHLASSHRVSEMVKCVENAYRHMEITLANQLALAYPDLDVRELLKLAGTKWNVGTFHPSFGTGGYCIPLSSQYVLDGSPLPQELSLLSDTMETDMAMRRRIADSVADRGCRKVAVLGLSYRGNLKVSILSPTIGIVERLRERGVEVRVYDPYYSAEEIKAETGAGTFKFPEELAQFDGLLITADHREFASSEVKSALQANRGRPLVLDNYGLWASWRLRDQGFSYFMPGEPNWLGGR